MRYVGMSLEIELSEGVIFRDWFFYNLQDIFMSSTETFACTARMIERQYYIVTDDFISDNPMSIVDDPSAWIQNSIGILELGTVHLPLDRNIGTRAECAIRGDFVSDNNVSSC